METLTMDHTESFHGKEDIACVVTIIKKIL